MNAKARIIPKFPAENAAVVSCRSRLSLPSDPPVDHRKTGFPKNRLREMSMAFGMMAFSILLFSFVSLFGAENDLVPPENKNAAVFPKSESRSIPEIPRENRTSSAPAATEEVLQYRRYYVPNGWITDILAGPELYLPVRQEEFDRWIHLLEAAPGTERRPFTCGDQLVRTVLEATLDDWQFINGSGTFEFRPDRRRLSSSCHIYGRQRCGNRIWPHPADHAARRSGARPGA